MQEMIVWGIVFSPPIQPNSQDKKPHKIRDFWVSECQKRAGSTPKLQKNHPDYSHNRGKIFMLF